MTQTRWPAALVLENGKLFRGEGYGAHVESIGEVVFNTSITGYQEIISDPSYCGQIVVMTATQIGNVGVNRSDTEARRVACAGFAIRELSPRTASWRADDSLASWLDQSGVPGIDGIDTRALTRCLRDGGAMRGAITPQVDDIAAVLERVRQAPRMDGLDLVPRVTCAERYEWSEPSWRALDDGRAIAALTGAPARAFGLPGGGLTVGAVADLCVIDPERPVTITADELASKSKNTPFLGQTLAGRAVLTLVEGRVVFDLDARMR